MTTSLIGTTLGNYSITDVIGRGGMATVYKAEQKPINRSVAIKVLPEQPDRGREFIERFQRESQTVARLQHPHILPVFDYGEQSNICYLVMPYLANGTVSDRIRTAGAFAPRDVAKLISQVADALDYAHGQGIIHRDIKPQNMLLDSAGNVLLSDFGIAKLIGEMVGDQLTATGSLLGTPAYMSPEQAQGKAVDRRSDIYSLAIVVFEMLTGQQPFRGETSLEVILQQVNNPAPSARALADGLPDAVDDVLARALAKAPADRYTTARDFADELAEVLKDAQPLARSTALPPLEQPTAAVERPTLPVNNTNNPTMNNPTTTNPTITVVNSGGNPLVLLGGFALIALALVAIVFVIASSRSESPPAATADAPSAVAKATTPATRAPAAAQTVGVVGRASYSTVATLGDTISVRADRFTPPSSGTVYAAWLRNTETQDTLPLGELRIDALGAGALTFTTEGDPLPTRYNALLITREQQISDTPSGAVIYSGEAHPVTMSALYAIPIASPDGLPVRSARPTEPGVQYADEAITSSSLLAGALEEGRIARQHAGLAAGASTPRSMHLHAEHTINILRGTQEDHDGDGRPENPGRGVGVIHFLDRITEQIDAVNTTPGISDAVQGQIELIRVCVMNARGWTQAIIDEEQTMLETATIEAAASQREASAQLASWLMEGNDQNGNGIIDPFEGECGLGQIADFALIVGNLIITEAT